ncbi:RrF2 family transcriptional regulator [Stackebrandtia nassauensis]|uniref:Transcriptional regulator, BadM/Rrf2 family n=1 Tax=Stackebrandtia nassauensis (strain DSM 44728 / CIP 108903 / NRRL B-16338 / NBRC 102104 / LLR-40K-21) TaxID=446470 RepID=D3Q329_STANL|nr:Rrf2 family transcriptional regulator [Stackebrandtia nassauensis]ADD39999.1 transcriptional regulator, BadM/Rrf2 family [Stackebrandtia nassauensis DSM 44728]
MKMTSGVEWALHACVTLSQAADPVPAARLAELHGTPPAYLAKQLQSLARAGIVTSTAGQVGGYTLTRPATEVTVLEVVQAVDGTEPAYRCTEIRQRGPLAVPAEKCERSCAIARAMAEAQEAWSRALSRITIADLARGIDADSDGTAMADVRGWLAAV